VAKLNNPTPDLSFHTDIVNKKFENFKRRIGIAEKSHETRRDRWGGNVNHKSLF